MKEIQMLAMDFDNTLYDHNEGKATIHPELLTYLKLFIEQGGYAGIVTGRRLYDMQLLFEIMDIPWGTPYFNYYIYRESFVDFVEDGTQTSWEEYNLPARKRISDSMYRLGHYAGDWQARMAEHGLEVASWDLYGDFALEYRMESPEQAQKAIPLLQDLLATEGLEEEYHIHRNVRLATIIDGQSGKGNVLHAAAQHVGLAPHQVLAIGDSLNDLPMMKPEMGFVPGCVGNADQPLIDAVMARKGYIGKGRATDSILDIIDQLADEGRILSR